MRKIFTLQFYINYFHTNRTSTLFQSDFETLDVPVYEAPGHCVRNVMNFARSYRVAETNAAGKVEMILN